MTEHDTKQDHPGPEWVEFYEHADGTAYFQHHALGEDVAFGGNCPTTRAEAVERCRAIRAAALHWERRKAEVRGDADSSHHLMHIEGNTRKQ